MESVVTSAKGQDQAIIRTRENITKAQVFLEKTLWRTYEDHH